MSTLLDSGCHASLCNAHDGINLLDILILVATLQDEYPISVCNLTYPLYPPAFVFQHTLLHIHKM